MTTKSKAYYFTLLLDGSFFRGMVKAESRKEAEEKIAKKFSGQSKHIFSTFQEIILDEDSFCFFDIIKF